MLERQKAELDTYLKKEVALEKKAFDKMMEHRAQIKRLCRIIKLNQLRLFTKTVDKLEKQNKKIEKRITCKGLIKREKQDAADVKAVK